MASAAAEFVEVLEPVLCERVVTAYEGQVSENGGCYEGTGSAALENGTNYEGAFVNGLMHGHGKMVWPDSTVYEGVFTSGLITGSGKYQWPDGSTYSGAVKNGLRDGFGVFHCSGGQIYEGDWSNGRRHGHGTMSYFEKTSTVVYVGAWLNGLREGYGKMTYSSGNSYEGEWSKDKKHGSGAMIWGRKGEEVYIGQWESDKMHGYGEFIWGGETGASRGRGDSGSDSAQQQINNIYRGQWRHGQRSGEGTFFYADGSQYAGSWEANTKSGVGVMIYQDGRVVAGNFSKDKITTSYCYNDVNPSVQFRVLFDDVFMKLSVEVPAAPHFLKQTQELERLILRFTSYLKIIYKRLSEAANQRRHSSNLSEIVASDPYIADWSKVERTQALARILHSRFTCMTMTDLQNYLQEINVMNGSYFTSADLYECLAQMRSHHKSVVRSALANYQPDRVHSTQATYWCELVDSFLGPKDIQLDHSKDPRQPLREREFVELLVRCVAHADFKRRIYLSSTSQPFKALSLQNTITDVLARRIYVSATSSISSASSSSSSSSSSRKKLTAVVNSAVVQAALVTAGQTLRKLWDQGPQVDAMMQLKSALLLLRKVGSLSIASTEALAYCIEDGDINVRTGADDSGADLLIDSAVGDNSESEETKGSGSAEEQDVDCPATSFTPQQRPIDFSQLQRWLNFDDFKLLLCRALCNDSLYVDNAKTTSSPDASSSGEASDEGAAARAGASETPGAADTLKQTTEGKPPQDATHAPQLTLEDTLSARITELVELLIQTV